MMAIMVVHDATGFRPDDYEAVRAAIGWEAQPPAGCVLHLVGHDSTGLLNLELWDSEDLYRDYVRTRFNPAFERLGLPHPPEPRILFLHNGLQIDEALAHVPRIQPAYA